uniref:Uncharacterized protein n=1 Tax=Cryptomonas curvata TaxID=233186 RepID=A0A7S0N3L2_9CRYP|mmetsp:Transcript_60998/g.127870  ORF Transcript_60998/g.127870 Transcript_60998/m.127870 type:complete len:367 (+) Transcript_60998:152-1252(+)
MKTSFQYSRCSLNGTEVDAGADTSSEDVGERPKNRIVYADVRAHRKIVAYEQGLPKVSGRILISCVALAALSPLLLVGPSCGKYMRKIPSIPPVRWTWTQSLVRPDPHLIASNQQRLAFANSNHQNKLSATDESNLIIEERDMAIAPRSIWTFGPFVMSVGILVSVLLKLFCAPYFAKYFTDFLRALLHSQLQDDDSLRRASAVPGAPPTASVAATTTTPVPAAPAAGVCSQPRPSSSPRRSPKWPCSLDLPETNSRGSGGRPQPPMPAGPGSHAGGADAEERSARRVTFSDSEQGGPADHEPPHGAAGSAEAFEGSGLHPALRRAAESNSTFGKALRHEISKHSPTDEGGGSAAFAGADQATTLV